MLRAMLASLVGICILASFISGGNTKSVEQDTTNTGLSTQTVEAMQEIGLDD